MSAEALVVTVSDRSHAGERRDESGPAAEALLRRAGYSTSTVVVPDGEDSVAEALGSAIEHGYRLVITSGGTGVGHRDRTPEGTRRVLDRELPGIAEMLRSSPGKPHAYLSRGVAGVVDTGTLIVNLPGSPQAVTEGLTVLIPVLGHLLDQLAGGDH